MNTRRQLWVLLLIVAVMAAGGAIDASVGRPTAPGVNPGSGASQLAALGGPDSVNTTAQSEAWYCPGASGSKGPAPGTLLLTNSAPRSVPGTVSAVVSNGSRGELEVSVPAGGYLAVSLAKVADGPWVSAMVLLQGGGVAVSEQVSGPLGWSAQPCFARLGTSWYFAHGATAGGSLELSLFNPSPTDAVADVTLVTSQSGTLAPAAYQELAVPSGSVVALSLGDHAQNDPSVATEVTVLSGQLAAAELQQYSQPGNTGLALIPGSAPGDELAFPVTTDLEGETVTYHLFDPSSWPTTVTIDLGLTQGSAAPIEVPLGAGAGSDLVAESQVRIPANIGYSAVLRSSGGVGIVASREISAPAGAPAPVHGEVVAMSSNATQWLVPAIDAPGTAWSLALCDLGPRPASVSISTLAIFSNRSERIFSATVSASSPVVIGPNPPAPIGSQPLVVTASQPMALELDAVPSGAPGIVVSPAFPMLGPPER